MPERLSVAQAQREFAAEGTYLNTATLGLPPTRSWDALQGALEEWRTGDADPLAYDRALGSARRSYARIVRMDPDCVGVGSQVSAFAGVIAASLPDGAEVLTAEGDFTSILFPFLAQAHRGVTVRCVPLESIAASVRESTTVVSVSSVQSADGRLVDLDSLEAASAATGTRVLLDTTQSTGWLPGDAGRFAYSVCAGYKWLLAPRGTAYVTVLPDLLDELVPHLAGWYAGDDPWSSVYGAPLRLAPDARRLDLSPVWHSWVAAAPSLELLEEVGLPGLHDHSVGLANRFRTAVGMDSADSAIVSLPVGGGAAQAVSDAGIVAAVRNGRLRLSFHLCNDEDDADHAAGVLRTHLVA